MSHDLSIGNNYEALAQVTLNMTALHDVKVRREIGRASCRERV